MKSSSSISHYGIRIAVDGSVTLQVRISPFVINSRSWLEWCGEIKGLYLVAYEGSGRIGRSYRESGWCCQAYFYSVSLILFFIFFGFWCVTLYSLAHMEAFCNQLVFFSLESRNKIVEVRPAGKIASGITEVRTTDSLTIATVFVLQ